MGKLSSCLAVIVAVSRNEVPLSPGQADPYRPFYPCHVIWKLCIGCRPRRTRRARRQLLVYNFLRRSKGAHFTNPTSRPASNNLLLLASPLAPPNPSAKFTLPASSSWTVLKLKRCSSTIHKIPPPQQRLIYMGRILTEPTATLSTLGMTDGPYTVHLFPRPIISSTTPPQQPPKTQPPPPPPPQTTFLLLPPPTSPVCSSPTRPPPLTSTTP